MRWFRRALLLVMFFAVIAGVAEARSGWARSAFRRANPCPGTGATTGPCEGFVIDHKEPLCAGGADSPANMQWQERKESLEKDRLERAVCMAARQ